MRLTRTLTLLAAAGLLAAAAAEAREVTNHRPPIAKGADNATGPPNRSPLRINDAAAYNVTVDGTTGRDIQDAIDAAEAVGPTAGSKAAVLLTPGETYTLTEPLRVPSHVVIDGTGGDLSTSPGPRPRLVMSPGGCQPAVVSFEDTNGSVGAALYYTQVEVNGNAKRGVMVSSGSDTTYIYDNVLIDEAAGCRPGSTDVGRASQQSVLIEPRARTTHVYVDGNVFSHFSTGVSIRENDVSYVLMFANHFKDWRHFGVSVQRQVVTEDKPSRYLVIRNNHFFPPKKTDGTRKPIDFQSRRDLLQYPATIDEDDPEYESQGAVHNVTIENNILEGVPGEAFVSKSVVSRATADMITGHRVRKLVIRNNLLTDGGEVGVNVSRGTFDSIIQANRIVDCDSCAINVGVMPSAADLNAGLDAKDLEVDFIRVRDNELLENARNKFADEEASPASFRPRIRSGVVIDNADTVILTGNTIREQSDDTRYYTNPDAKWRACTEAVLDAWQAAYTPSTVPATTMQGISLRNLNNPNAITTSGNVFDLPDHAEDVVQYPIPGVPCTE